MIYKLVVIYIAYIICLVSFFWFFFFLKTRETGRDGGYPIHCLSTDVTQPADQAGIASCDLFNQELTQTARQVFKTASKHEYIFEIE